MKKGTRESKLLTLLLSLSILFSTQIAAVYAQGDEPAEAVYQLTGTVCQYGYDQAETSGAAKSGIEVTIELANGSTTVTSDSNGNIAYTFEDEAARTDTGKYSWSIAKDGDHFEASGTLEEGTEEDPVENKLYVRERYIPSGSDFEFEASENVKVINGEVWLKSAGSYAIKGKSGKKISKILDGSSSSEVSVNVSSAGVVENIFIFIGNLCSKVLSGFHVNVDSGAPVIESVTTKPANDNTTVKEHGVYGRTKAEIILEADITESAGLQEVYLVSTVGGETKRYDATEVQGEDDQYSATIPLPEEETIMDAQLVKLVAVDVFGNRSDEVLISQTEEGSKITLEQIPPTLSKGVVGTVSEYGWYKELPTIRATASDNLSGLNRLIIYGQGNTIASERYDDKTLDEQTISGEIKFSDLTDDGRYTYTAEARDNSLNITEEQIIVRVDTVAPEVTISGAEEGGFYKASPAVTVNETEKYYTEEGNRIFVTVTRDGNEVLDKTFTGVNTASLEKSTFDTDGTYKVTVSAKDAADNESEEVNITFIKDSTPPETEITHDGTINSYGWLNKAPTVTASAKDTLSGLTKLSLSQDGKEKVSKEYDRSFKKESVSAAADVSSPSDDGSYKFSARSEDRAGNTITKEISLNIDTVAPVITSEGVKTGEHYKVVPVIKVSETEKYYAVKGNRIFVKVLKDGKSVHDKTYEQVNSLQVPQDIFSGDGVYEVTISAKDAADNASNTLTYKFTKDATSPKVSIGGVKEGKFYNTKQTVSVKVIEHNWQTNNVTVTAVKKLGGTKNMGFPWKNKAEETVNSKTYSETGTYTITASATDKAGNASATKKVRFTIDTKPPVITITGVTDGGIYTYGQGLNPGATVTDDYLASKSITFTKAGVAVADPSFEQLKENDGVYTMTVTAADKAGNTARKQITFTVNRFGSYFEYNDALKALMGKGVQNVDKDLVITEKNVSRVIETDARVYRDGKALDASAKTSKDEGGAEKIYRHVYASSLFSEEGAYELNVISKDEVGNEMESKDENGKVRFYVDRTAPSLSLSGIDPKGNKAESITVTVNAKDLLTGVESLEVTVDDEHPGVTDNEDGTYTFVITEGLRQKVHVTAVDGAGNAAEINDKASVSTNALSLFLNRFGMAIAAVIAALIAFILVFFKRRKKDDEEKEAA